MEETKSKKNNHTVKRRLNITITFAIAAALFCGYIFYLMRMNVSHSHVFLMFFTGVSFLVLTYMLLWTLGAVEKYLQVSKILKRCYFISLLLGLVFFIILQVLIISGSHTDEDADVGAVIVLGAGLINNNPSLVLASRLDAAVKFTETREDIPIIVTGGLGQGQTITEAEAMAGYLIRRGVDENRIWKEEASTNSHENIGFAKEIMIEKGIYPENNRVAIVTNDFHIYRAKITAEKAGLEPYGVAAETPGLHRKLIYHFREAFSLLNEWVFR